MDSSSPVVTCERNTRCTQIVDTHTIIAPCSDIRVANTKSKYAEFARAPQDYPLFIFDGNNATFVVSTYPVCMSTGGEEASSLLQGAKGIISADCKSPVCSLKP